MNKKKMLNAYTSMIAAQLIAQMPKPKLEMPEQKPWNILEKEEDYSAENGWVEEVDERVVPNA